MANSNKVLAVAAVLFLAVAITPLLAEPTSPMFPKMDPVCATVMPDLLEKCFATVRAIPTDDCCNDLKSATTTQVTCLCDNYIANPAIVNITGPYSAGITTKCGVFDKYSCDGTSKDGSSSNSTSTSNGPSEGNGGRANKVAASVGVFGFVATLFFVMF
ncbi:Non-specific lipid transfer protein GPI-anchored 28 [Cardamine amara subsp. amara]|uniref:Non-specific lipid transfer protein GPI-anchored 28 n=1 Tax=Cardamine amara subsp. amara TaxID=228776 RepID=A0ABD1AEN5_CARAN